MTGLVLDHLWQSTLFAGAAGLAALALRRNGAEVRYWVWFAAALKFLIPLALVAGMAAWLAAHLHAQAPAPPRFELARRMLEPMTAPGPAPALRPSAFGLPASGSFDAGPYVAAAWALGATAVLWRRLAQWRALTRALAAASPVAVPVPLPTVATVARSGPAVVGFLRPILVLPQGLTERLTPAELEAVLEHELHHARRLDNLLTLPLLLVQALFWFHPLVWWIGRRLLCEREQACDEAVLRGGADAETYARGLLEVCRLALDPAPILAAAMGGASLKRRIRRIMTDRPPQPLHAPARLMLTAALGAAIAAPVLAGVFTAAPAGTTRLLVHLTRPVAAAVAAHAAAQPLEPREATALARPSPPKAARLVLASAAAALTEVAATAPSEPRPIRLARRTALPEFQPSASEPSGLAAAPSDDDQPSSADPQLLRALTERTAYVPGVDLGVTRMELRGPSTCPTAGVVDAERRLGGEAVSTAFDGRARRFVDEALAGTVGPREVSPAMALVVRKTLPALRPALAARFGGAEAARLIGEDRHGHEVYLVRAGGAAYVLVLLNEAGQIEAAMFCAAE